MRKIVKRERAQFKQYRELRLVAPFPGGGTYWAIPYWCVLKESGGSWSADNPSSDARGAYQLLGHGEPWPVNNWADKMAHHRIAGALYASSGLQPWVACS